LPRAKPHWPARSRDALEARADGADRDGEHGLLLAQRGKLFRDAGLADLTVAQGGARQLEAYLEICARIHVSTSPNLP